MNVNDFDPLNRARVILQSASIPCVTWLDGATEHHITYFQKEPVVFDYLLVRDFDEAVAQLEKYGWWILPRQEPPDAIAFRGDRCVPWRGTHSLEDFEPTSLPQRRLSPPVPYDAHTSGSSIAVQTVILMLDSDWGYSVDAHSKRFPSDSDMWVFPTIGEYANSLITYLLDPDGAAKRGGIHCVKRNLWYLYRYGLPIRDPKVINQITYENRQCHIDHLYDNLSTGSSGYRDHAAEVRQQILAGERGINDAVTEYELVAKLRGKKLAPRDPKRVRTPAPEAEEAREYHVSREALRDDTVFREALEEFRDRVENVRQDGQSYLDWAEEIQLDGAQYLLDDDYLPWLLELGHDRLDNNGPKWPDVETRGMSIRK